MSRLDRLEGLYLNILRVTILVLATGMLVAAVVGLVTAAPKLMPSFGTSDARKLVQGDRLKNLRDAGRTNADASGDTTTSAAPAAPARVDSRIVTAAKNFVAWGAKSGQSFGLGQVETVLNDKQHQLTDDLQGDYADSLVTFSRDVLADGRPSDDVNQLIEWHYGRFSQAETQAAEENASKAAKTALDRQKALVIAGAAASAFLTFLVLVFVFVLVKIERNLRLVRVVDTRTGVERAT